MERDNGIMEKEQKEEITRLFLLYYNKLLIYARNVLKNDSLAEEAVQEVFRIACQKPECLCNDRGNQFPWLVVTLKNVISNILRSQATAQRKANEYGVLYRNVGYMNDELSPDLLYEDISETEDYKLVKKITLDGQSMGELAQLEGVSYSALQKRLSRAKKALQAKMEELL